MAQGASKVYEKQGYIILRVRNGYIVYNTNKVFSEGHTHLKSFAMAKTLIDNCIKHKRPKTNTLMGLDNSRLVFIFILVWGIILCYNLLVGEKLSTLLRARPCGAALSTYLSTYIGVLAIELNWSSSSIHFRSDYQLIIVFQIGVSG